MPLTAEPKQEEITLKVCQSASFNVEAQGLGEVYLEEEEEDTPNTEHAPVEEEEEEDDLCHAEVVTESLSSTGQLPTTTAGTQAVRRSPSKGVSVVSGVNKAMPQTKSHMCSDCGKGFTRLFHLRRHKCGSSAFSCHKCGATFASRPQLAQHRRSHSKPHGCPYCEKRFRDTFNLRLHVRTHTGERPYQCSDCGDTFAQKRGLLEHLNTHTGQRPFVCHECGKAFCHSRTLSKHCQLHSDMRPFLCTLCGKTFKIKDSLKRHQLIHDKVST